MTLVEDTQFIVPTEEVRSRMPRALFAVTWTGKTATGRRQKYGMTLRSKADLDKRVKFYRNNGFDNVQAWTATLDWTEVQVD